MVFSSIQAYLDSSNWQQVPPSNYNQGGGGTSTTGDHVLLPQPQPQPNESGGCNGGSIRPGSLIDRARQANVAIPEASLKCPRCESTNTKFCYFNNYSLTQPRHFCKTCRRYWTRGGALRNVPVGGGFRRNRRTKSSTSNNNSSATSFSSATSGNASTISAILNANYGGNQESILSQMRVMNPSYNHLGDLTDNTKTDSLNYGGFNQDLSSLIPMGSIYSHHYGNLEDSSNYHNGFYPFESPRITSVLGSQFSSVKAEDNPYKWVNVNGNLSSWTDLSTYGSSR